MTTEAQETIAIHVPSSKALARRAMALTVDVAAMEIRDVASHDDALQALKGVKRTKKEFEDHFADAKKKAHDAHRALCTAVQAVVGPLDIAAKELSQKISKYETAERKRAEEERRQREAEARAKAEEEQLEAAAKLEAAGDVEGAREVLNEEIEAPIDAEPEIAQVDGVHSRSTWSAEVVDLLALIRFIGKRKENNKWAKFLKADTVAIGKVARAMKEDFDFPGLKPVEKKSHAVRG